MTLLEAVSSGKPFRHKGGDKWYTEEHITNWKVKVADALSDEWEIQQKESFTREDVERAIHAAHRMSRDTDYGIKKIIQEAMQVAEEAE